MQSPMHRHFLVVIFLFIASYSSAQVALDNLLVKFAHDADMVRRLKQFKADGPEKRMDVSYYQPEDFIRTANVYLGTPYRYGGESTSGMDCSGLIVRTMKDLGLQAPHNANELAKYGKIILDKAKLKPGDLIFFSRTYNTPRLISHVGFVIEGERMLHASNSGVHVTSIHHPYYYDKYYLFGTRIFDGVETLPSDVPAVAVAPVAKPEVAAVDIMQVGYTATLRARVYDKKYKGKYTDSGEKYKKGSLTASHAKYPFGTRLKLTNRANGRSVVVRVNDKERGRLKKGMHLSKKAARKLKLKKGRAAKVRLEVLSMGS